MRVASACTGLRESPRGPFHEGGLICGHRAGKSFVLALIAVYLGFKNYADALTTGEVGTIMIIAAHRKQARRIMRYVRGLLSVPKLAKLVVRETAEAFDLGNRVTIEIGTASIRKVLGDRYAGEWPRERFRLVGIAYD